MTAIRVNRQVLWQWERYFPVQLTRDNKVRVVCTRCRDDARNDVPKLNADGWLATKPRHVGEPPKFLCPACVAEEAA